MLFVIIPGFYIDLLFSYDLLSTLSHTMLLKVSRWQFSELSFLAISTRERIIYPLLKIKTYFENTQLFILIRSTRSLQSIYDVYFLPFFATVILSINYR